MYISLALWYLVGHRRLNLAPAPAELFQRYTVNSGLFCGFTGIEAALAMHKMFMVLNNYWCLGGEQNFILTINLMRLEVYFNWW